MDIVIIAQYAGDMEHPEKYNGRFTYLAKMLSEGSRDSVELVTTTFMHDTKRQANDILKTYVGCKITALYEPGYPRNVCLKRIRSHHILAKNLKKYLMTRKKPDVVYAAVPSLDVAGAAAEYCQQNNIRFLLDIQDLWPEAFQMVFHVPLISDMIFAPMRKKADEIYSAADEIIAVSQTYANRALQVNKKCKSPYVVYLGTEKKVFDMYAQPKLARKENIRIAYVGTLGNSYDLNTVIMAMSTIDSNFKIELVVMGDGLLRGSFEKLAKEQGVSAQFTGRLPYTQMISYLSQCDIAVNPIKKGSAGSILNKAADYAMAGLPVINTQECQEYRDLLDLYGAGINCDCEDVKSVADNLQKLIKNQNLRKKMSEGSRKLGREKFDRANTYKSLVSSLIDANESDKSGGGIMRLAYVGTLGSSYDLEIIFKALKMLDNSLLEKIRFVVMGDGPKRAQFEEYASGLPVLFTGRLPYQDMVWILTRCDIAINAIVRGSAQSIINKHADYAMAGLPIISTQETGEYSKLIEEYECGINCGLEDPAAVRNAIEELVKDKQKKALYGSNSRKMGEEKFDRERAYSAICREILRQ